MGIVDRWEIEGADDVVLVEGEAGAAALAETAGEVPRGHPRSAIDADWRLKAALIVAMVAVAFVSFIPVGDHFSSPDAYQGTISSLDAKKDTVMTLVAASTAASAAVSLLPGDAGTPIAEKLIDLSSDFLIVITALYLEKYLLTILGFAAFKVLVPASCALVVVAAFLGSRPGLRVAFRKLAAKLAVFGLAICCVVPASVAISGMIEATYESSIDDAIATAGETADEIEESVQETGDAGTSRDGEQGAGGQEPGLIEMIAQIPGAISQLPDSIAQGAADLTASARETLNNFIEALAVMIVTSCVIPILVLVFFLWLVKLILGVDVQAPLALLRPRTLRKAVK